MSSFSTSTCSVPACPRGGKLSRGLCSTHYARWRRHGDVQAPDHRRNRPRVEVVCTVLDCEKPVRSKSLCGSHYKRWLRHGDPLGGRQVVADRDRAQVTKNGPSVLKNRVLRPAKRYRSASAPGHPLSSADGKVLVHRRVLYDTLGPGLHACHWCGIPVAWATGAGAIRNLVADHLDHNKLNNHPDNLVPACNPCNGHRTVGAKWLPWVPGSPVGEAVREHAVCRRGHPLVADNVYVRPDSGGRQCRECIRHRARERRGAAGIPVRNLGEQR